MMPYISRRIGAMMNRVSTIATVLIKHTPAASAGCRARCAPGRERSRSWRMKVAATTQEGNGGGGVGGRLMIAERTMSEKYVGDRQIRHRASFETRTPDGFTTRRTSSPVPTRRPLALMSTLWLKRLAAVRRHSRRPGFRAPITGSSSRPSSKTSWTGDPRRCCRSGAGCSGFSGCFGHTAHPKSK